jgi:hypothetical protein
MNQTKQALYDIILNNSGIKLKDLTNKFQYKTSPTTLKKYTNELINEGKIITAVKHKIKSFYLPHDAPTQICFTTQDIVDTIKDNDGISYSQLISVFDTTASILSKKMHKLTATGIIIKYNKSYPDQKTYYKFVTACDTKLDKVMSISQIIKKYNCDHGMAHLMLYHLNNDSKVAKLGNTINKHTNRSLEWQFIFGTPFNYNPYK